MERNEQGKFKKEYDVNENFFEIIDNEEKAYILGFFYADGCNQNNNGSKSISFTQLEQDVDILDKIKDAMESNHKYCEMIQETNGKRKFRLQFYSQKLSDDLFNLGAVYNKSLILKFPTTLSEQLMPHFIRGYFDGDGCIWMGKPKIMEFNDKKDPNKVKNRFIFNTKFTFTGNFDFINSLQDYLVTTLKFKKTKLNFSKAKETKHICTMEYSGKNQIKTLYDYMYTNATIFGNRKKTKFEEINCADNKKLLSETRLIAGKPEMVISSEASTEM